MNIEAKQICEKLTPLLAFISGAESQKIELISSPDQAFEDSIVFVGNSQVLDQVLKSNAAAIVVSEKNIEKTKGFKGTVLSSPHVPLAMSLVGRYFFPVTTHKVPFDGENRHPSAVIAKSATVAKSAIIHPNVTIGAETVIGENCIIGANTTIGSNWE